MSEQELDDLDHAVARALGGELDGDGWRFPEPLEMYGCAFIKTKRSFCRDWEYGGPIIESEKIESSFMGDGHGWQAAVNPFGSADYTLKWIDGETPLIAAMLAFVASKAEPQIP